MTVATQELVRYGRRTEPARRSWDSQSEWTGQMDMAASALAAAALRGGMPRVAATVGGEKDLADFLAGRTSQKRRAAVLKLLVVFLAEVIGVAAGLYIGTLT